jgi:biofilm PGA synthesis N-glycosyltransferase PgaC
VDITAGIITHNDKSLPKLIDSVCNQKKNGIVIKELFIVSSGILPENKHDLEMLCKKHPIIKIIHEPKRAGKAKAVNMLLAETSCRTCVLLSGDILIEPNSISELLKPLADGDVGMTGARTIPLNDKSTFIGFAVHFIWQVHHRLSLIQPKLGELVGFRSVIECISQKTAVDEAWMESVIVEKGYRTAYAPTSIAYNMGPQNITEYINQRKRIHIGHVNLKRERGYVVASMAYRHVFIAVLECLSFKPKEMLWILIVILLELYIRISSDIDVIVFNRNPSCWDILPSAKISKAN